MRLSRKLKLKKELAMKECRYCLATENLTIDHKIPIVQGGTDDISNLQCLCRRCNEMKSRLSHRQVQGMFRWFREIEKARVANGKEPIFNREQNLDYNTVKLTLTGPEENLSDLLNACAHVGFVYRIPTEELLKWATHVFQDQYFQSIITQHE